MNLVKSFKNIKALGVLAGLLFASTLPGVSINISDSKNDVPNWKVIKVDNKVNPTWTIYMRRIAGTDFYEYKIEGDVEASPNECIASFRQGLYDEASDYKKFPTYEMVEDTEESILTYVIHNEPFFLKDTEMSLRYTFLNSKDGSTGASWTEAWDECSIQPSKKLNRIETFRGSWSFTPISDKTTKSEYKVQFELKGMPLWLGEPMVIKILKEGLENIRMKTADVP